MGDFWTAVSTGQRSVKSKVVFKMAGEGFFFSPLVLLILPKECHDEFFVKFNFFHGNSRLYVAIADCLTIMR